jgi:putative dehydrogenase
MAPTVAIIAPGNMGAAVGARLVQHGATVLTTLEGRSRASAERAAAAGMAGAETGALVQADFLLSIVPPGEAVALAERLAPALRASNRKPLYVDCNAVSPATVARIAGAVAQTGAPFADAGIVGPPPRPGTDTTRFYVSGPESGRLAALNDYGLSIRMLDGAVGDASALKMCYGGLNKGVTALGAAMALAATRAGVGEAFRAELAESQSALLGKLGRGVPDMFDKAYRWVAEMEEIAAFTGAEAERETYRGLAALFARLASDHAGEGREIADLAAFFAATPSKPK